MNFKIILPIILFSALFLASSCQDSSDNTTGTQFPDLPDLSVGQPAPGFTIQKYGGGTIGPEQFNGKVVMIDFWATWCGPCVASIPNLRLLNEKYKDKGLIILSVSLDNIVEQWNNFLEKNDMPWEHGYDAEGIADYLYQIDYIPQVYIVDKEGKIAFGGYPSQNYIEHIIEESLNK